MSNGCSMNNNTPVTLIRAARMCPVCGNYSRVYRSQEMEDGSIRRKRQCRSCGFKFLTVELFSAELGGESAQN